MWILKQLSRVWKGVFALAGLAIAATVFREAPGRSVGLGNSLWALLSAVGLSGWDPFGLSLELLMTRRKATDLTGLNTQLGEMGIRTPSLLHVQVIKILRWCGMTWNWTVLFVSAGYGLRTLLAASGPWEMLKGLGAAVLWCFLFGAGGQELPMGIADLVKARMRPHQLRDRSTSADTYLALGRTIWGMAALALMLAALHYAPTLSAVPSILPTAWHIVADAARP